MVDRIATIIESAWWEAFIVTLILVNAIVLGLMTSGQVMAAAGDLLALVDQVILAIFVVEIAMRIFVHRLAFFRDPWSLFDFFVVAIALPPSAHEFSVLRALRVLRLLRLVSVVPQLRRVVGGLVSALPGMGSVILLMLLIFYVFSVMATTLYGAAFPDWFGSIGLSAYTLFQIMTLESWSMGIVRPVMEAFPWAWLFFVPFIMATAFTVLNLFIGIIVSAMQEDMESEARAERQSLHDEQVNIAEEIRALRTDVDQIRQLVIAMHGDAPARLADDPRSSET